MPIWLRRFHLEKIIEFKQQQQKEYEKVQKGTKSTSNKPVGPNVSPNSTYNF